MDFSFDFEKQKAGLGLLLDDTSRSCIKVMELSGTIIGMVSAQITISTAAGGRAAWIEDMVIHHEYRSQGYGSELLASLESWCRGQQVLRLQLCADKLNPPASAFYRKQGWKGTSLEVFHKFL